MKFAAALISTLAMLLPTAAQADVVLTIRARIAPQCEVISVTGVPGTSDITVRTACNVPRYLLVVDDVIGPQVAVATAQNASVATTPDGAVDVSVENPGIQTVSITLDAPMGADLPVVTLQAA